MRLNENRPKAVGRTPLCRLRDNSNMSPSATPTNRPDSESGAHNLQIQLDAGMDESLQPHVASQSFSALVMDSLATMIMLDLKLSQIF